MPSERLNVTTNGQYCDDAGNIVCLRGVNFDASIKNPAYPKNTNTHTPLCESNTFYSSTFDGISYVDHPFPVKDTKIHINRLKSLGYNSIRFPFTWEALEHEGPGKYDYKYMDYVIEVLREINNCNGMYVYLDPHQDVWSRFTGGSGAPLWTLYAAGFEPTRFAQTEAAILHNFYIDPKTGKEYLNNKFPKMLWPTNYTRLACQTMYTLFFAGKEFAPKCIINDMNIQDFLQQSFVKAIMTFYNRIKSKAPELITDNCLIGLETLNEPNQGYVGERDLGIVPKERSLKLDSTPTAFQSFMLGEGYQCIMDKYEITVFGPSKNKTKTVDPKGMKAWMTEEERDKIDKRMNWTRSPEWKANTCIWRLHGVWKKSNSEKQQPILLKSDYFTKLPSNPSVVTNEKYFINNFLLEYFRYTHREFRKLDDTSFLIIQPPVMREPPLLKGDSELMDGRIILACHFYDGMSLMYKSWNTHYNVDTFGIIRGKYSNPAFSVVLGEANIRKSLRKQLHEMNEDAKNFVGKDVPVLFTETGMPFDMNDKQAYTDGNYSAQISALDALHYALEGNNISYSLWCYCNENSHEWGDNWNNEDFSIWSQDDKRMKRKYDEIKKLSPRTKEDSKQEKKMQKKIAAYKKSEQKVQYARESGRPLSHKKEKTNSAPPHVSTISSAHNNTTTSTFSNSDPKSFDSSSSSSSRKQNKTTQSAKTDSGYSMWDAVAVANEEDTKLHKEKGDQESTDSEVPVTKSRVLNGSTNESAISLSNDTIASMMDKKNITTSKANAIPTTSDLGLMYPPCNKTSELDLEGFRALGAILRPYPMKMHGLFLYAEFDLLTKTYVLEVNGYTDLGKDPLLTQTRPSSGNQDNNNGRQILSHCATQAPTPPPSVVASKEPTYIYLPNIHFPINEMIIQASGFFTYDSDYQVLKWYHYAGPQTIRISIGHSKLSPSNNEMCTIM